MVKIGPVVLEKNEINPEVLKKKLLNFVNIFTLFRNYVHFEMGVVLHLNLNPLYQRNLCAKPSLAGIGLVILEKKIRM